jgi:hypothetical protein
VRTMDDRGRVADIVQLVRHAPAPASAIAPGIGNAQHVDRDAPGGRAPLPVPPPQAESLC